MKFSISFFNFPFWLPTTYYFLLFLLLVSCDTFAPKPTALEQLNNELSDKKSKNYSIILKDMGSESDSDFWHIYEVMEYPTANQDDMVTYDTQKYRVTADTFEKNLDHLGMELCYNSKGKTTYAVSSIGFNHLIGNEEYGKFMTVEEAKKQGIIEDDEMLDNQNWSSNLTDSDNTASADSVNTRPRRRSFLGTGLMWFFMGRYMGMNSSFRTRSQPITQQNYAKHQSYRQGRTKTPYKRPLTASTGSAGGLTSQYGKNWKSLPSGQRNIVKRRASSVAKTLRTKSALRKRSSGFGK